MSISYKGTDGSNVTQLTSGAYTGGQINGFTMNPRGGSGGPAMGMGNFKLTYIF